MATLASPLMDRFLFILECGWVNGNFLILNWIFFVEIIIRMEC